MKTYLAFPIDYSLDLWYNELMYDIEDCLNDSYEELEDLEWVSQTLSEYNYYNNTNK